MKKYFMILFLLSACSITELLPEARVTIKVIDETNLVINNARVGIGFEKNTGSGTKEIPVVGYTDNNGIFMGSAKALKDVGYNVTKDGYYMSRGNYKFNSKSNGRWQPWNPEIKVVLRKIENPVPMYARRFSNILPATDMDIGCDLIANDWVKPYGTGTHSDIVFYLKRNYVNDNNFNANLKVKFLRDHGGFKKYDLNMYNGSEFKLPRYADEDGYEKQFERNQSRIPSREIKDDLNKNIGYVFRVRATSKNTAMYGKIQGDINISAIKNDTLSIGFTYYLNPDHSRNLEFDPKRNLFEGLAGSERVGL